MKKTHLIVLSVAALLFGRPAGLCTANAAKTEGEPSVEDRLATLERENAELKKQISIPPDPAPSDGTLAMLCKGAGVDIADVRWRIQAGLDPDQAVQAAIAQKDFNESAAKASKAKK